MIATGVALIVIALIPALVCLARYADREVFEAMGFALVLTAWAFVLSFGIVLTCQGVSQ